MNSCQIVLCCCACCARVLVFMLRRTRACVHVACVCVAKLHTKPQRATKSHKEPQRATKSHKKHSPIFLNVNSNICREALQSRHMNVAITGRQTISFVKDKGGLAVHGYSENSSCFTLSRELDIYSLYISLSVY